MFELCHFSFGKRLSFEVVGSFVLVFDKPLDSHTTIVSIRPAGIAKVSKIG